MSGYASPPCMAAEIAPDYFDPMAVDPQQALDVARWRKAERARLQARRHAMPDADRHAAATALAAHVQGVLDARFGGARGMAVSAYLPIRDEPDLLTLLAAIHGSGVTAALPFVAVRADPLAFRVWTPGTPMVRGAWTIPVPRPDAPRVAPDFALIPLLGWTADGHRLGYGGGCIDRMLATQTPRPFAIGIGFRAARLATIFPQPHDVALDLILTEDGGVSV
jgi:5,10-methenyltetrahydrofolate synthetase